ncbi:MAG: DsbC family protein [Halioglobus sp.]|nr:DsbC family protein [Halioglobus sp.]
MSYRTLKLTWMVILMMAAPLGLAAQTLDEAELDALRAALNVGGVEVMSAQMSEMPGVVEVQLKAGPLVYSTLKGDFFIVGDLYSVGQTGFVNLAEQRRDQERVEVLAEVDRDDMIIFSPEGETLAYIYVFTDVSCYYCQKLHQEVPELNKSGVEVRYLAYPRAGVDSVPGKQLVSAWCAENPQETLTRLKSKESVPESRCKDNPVAAQFALGQELGVNGTPAIIMETGEMIPGYRPAADLIEMLGLNSEAGQ